jgi:hypothetical protein
MTERSGIEIDYCPDCRGVWLDRGELDKIIDRSSQNTPTNQPDNYPPRQDYKSDKEYQYRKKKSSWGDLFDF